MKNILLKFTTFTVLTLGFGSSQAVDVQNFLMAKGQQFRQTNAGTPVSIIAQRPFHFYSSALPTEEGSVSNATLRLPKGQVLVLTNFGDLFEYERTFTNKLQMDTAYPTGRYHFTFNTVADGRRTPALDMRPDAYPTVPRVLNWTDAQKVEAAQPLTLSWSPFSGGTANDFILLEIESPGADEPVFSSPMLLEPDSLRGTNVNVTIPAGKLNHNQTYTGRLLFVKRTASNATNYPGATGLAGFFRQTTFSITTLPEPPAAGRIQFQAGAYSVSEAKSNIVVTITRSGSEGTVGVTFSTGGGTATAGTDYVGNSFTITFDPGVTSTNVVIPIIEDYRREGNETVQLTLSNPIGGAVLGVRSNVVLTIVDNEVAAAGAIQFAPISYSVSETGKVANLKVLRTGGKTGLVGVRYTTLERSAISNDFVPKTGVLAFASGVTNKTLSIGILDDALDETNEYFQVQLTEGLGGVSIGSAALSTVRIIDNDTGGFLNFKATAFYTNENSAFALITVVRSGGLAGNVTVDFSTISGTATNGQDYVSTNGTLTFGSKQTVKTFTVPILQDTAPEGNESLFVRLSNPTGGARLGSLTNSSLVILDDELSVSIAKTAYTLSETNSSVTITVTRSGALKTAASVGFATFNGSATSTADYRGTNGVLTFPVNVASRTIVIPIVRDSIVEGDETFGLTLTNPQGVQLGTVTSTTVTILNDDFPGTIAFSSAAYSGFEGSNAPIVIRRTGGVASGVTVQFTTIAGTATAGADFTSVTTNITFAAGETSKTINVRMILDLLVEGNETVALQLSNPTGGASLGTQSTSTLTIKNKPDPNAVPGTGSPFFKATITGLNGNPVSKTLNVTPGTPITDTLFGQYESGLGWIHAINAKDLATVVAYPKITVTDHNIQFNLLKTTGPGILEINPNSTQGGGIWTFLKMENGANKETHVYGTGQAGSSGTITIDVLNPSTKVIAGRFNFVAVDTKSPHTKKVRISGSFRIKNGIFH